MSLHNRAHTQNVPYVCWPLPHGKGISLATHLSWLLMSMSPCYRFCIDLAAQGISLQSCLLLMFAVSLSSHVYIFVHDDVQSTPAGNKSLLHYNFTDKFHANLPSNCACGHSKTNPQIASGNARLVSPPVYVRCCQEERNYLLGWYTLQWRHDEPDGVSNHRGLDGLLNCLFRRRSKKTSQYQVTGICWVGGGGIHRWPVDSPRKGPVTRKMFPFDNIIMIIGTVVHGKCNLLDTWYNEADINQIRYLYNEYANDSYLQTC